VTAWLGNSEPVAAKHYLQVTDEHFRRAANALQKGRESACMVSEGPVTDESNSTPCAMKNADSSLCNDIGVATHARGESNRFS